MVMTVAAATQRRAILMIRNSIREEKNQRVWLSVLFRRGQGSVGRVALAQRFEMESDIFRFLFQRRFAIQAKGGASEDCRVRPTPTDRQLQSTWISFPGKLFRRGVYMPVISLYHLFCPDWFQWTVPIVLLSLQNLWIVFFFFSRNLFWRGGGRRWTSRLLSLSNSIKKSSLENWNSFSIHRPLAALEMNGFNWFYADSFRLVPFNWNKSATSRCLGAASLFGESRRWSFDAAVWSTIRRRNHSAADNGDSP